MKNTPALYEALTSALNCTFPAVLRCRSADSYEQLHSYAQYEQWYNAEIIMHLRREVNGSKFDGDWVRVRGEAPIGAMERRANWAIVPWDTPDTPTRSFDAGEVLAIAETKVIGLAAAGCGHKSESQKIVTLGQQAGHDALMSCLGFAYLVLPCWSRQRSSLDESALKSFDGYVFPKVSQAFSVRVGIEHVQCIIGGFGTEEKTQELSAGDTQFALVQLLLRRPPNGAWEAVMPSAQHRLSAYMAIDEARTPATVC